MHSYCCVKSLRSMLRSFNYGQREQRLELRGYNHEVEATPPVKPTDLQAQYSVRDKNVHKCTTMTQCGYKARCETHLPVFPIFCPDRLIVAPLRDLAISPAGLQTLLPDRRCCRGRHRAARACGK